MSDSDAEALVLMQEGMALMQESRPEAASEALACFDRALALRRQLNVENDAGLRYGLAACWLNRAEALLRLPGQAWAALTACDEGIALLQTLPPQAEARFLRHLIIAHQNRGLALQALTPPELAQAVRAFSDALALLQLEPADEPIADRGHLQAVVLTNLANAGAGLGTAEATDSAREAARAALALVAPLEADNVEAAEIGLKARHALCRALAPRLSGSVGGSVVPGGAIPDAVHEATDAADDALVLIRRWERNGITGFRPLAVDLFRFGSRVFALYQPQFLQAFILDNMDPDQSSAAYVADPAVRAAVLEAIQLAPPVGG